MHAASRNPIMVRALAISLLMALGAPLLYAATFDPENSDYLRRQYNWFHSLPEARQSQLRTLNDDFQKLDSETQNRYLKVMQQYNHWLSKLPEVERQRVLDAASPGQRLAIVKELREREWIETLPRANRDELAKLDGTAKIQRIKELQAEEADQRERWEITQRHWGDIKLGKAPAIFAQERPQLEVFVHNLRLQVSDGERKALDEARIAADDWGNFVAYAIEIVKLADSHALLPCKAPGPKDFASLPQENKDVLLKHRDFKFKKNLLVEEPKELKKVSGQWPAYALELNKYCLQHNIVLPKPLGDCTKEQMPDEVKAIIGRLETELLKKAGGPAQLELLKKAEGTWPEYPRSVVELAKSNKMTIPGWMLPAAVGPGQIDLWEKFRAKKKK